jgi:hypothetical protein
MQHLNYCRQIIGALIGGQSVFLRRPELATLLIAAEKFILPRGGIILDDPDLRGLEPDATVALPFPVIAIEWETYPGQVMPWGVQLKNGSKNVLLARQDGERIIVTSFVYIPHDQPSDRPGEWVEIGDSWFVGGEGFIRHEESGHLTPSQAAFETDNEPFPQSMHYVLYPIMGLLNALACSNVRLERSESKGSAKTKNALPFDSYHILTVGKVSPGATRSSSFGGTHRAPREHLRRGHIRRYESGLKVWVNATVVNPGVGGKVSKDYRLAA